MPEIDACRAIGIGPGLGVQPSSASVLECLLKSVTVPLILDADALNILSLHRKWLSLLPPGTLLTPHPKEFDRLFVDCTSGYERLHRAMEKAVEYSIYILLKGAYSATCTPEGNVYINDTGNPGMAPAGSGDVLTGVLLGLLAQGYEPEKAAVTGAWLHGQAGDLAVAENSQESLIARDLIRKLGKTFKLQENEAL